MVFFKRFWRLFSIMFPGWRDVSVLCFLFLLLISLLEQFIIYYVGTMASRFYKVLGDKDAPGFRIVFLESLAIIIAISFVKSTRQYGSSVLYVTWREHLVKKLHRYYFKDITYYHINVICEDIDNPDQRITQDIDRMSRTFSEIITQLLISPFIIGFYTYQAWVNTGYIGPVGTLAFFIVMTIINKLLMSPVVSLVFAQENLEGDFRFKHMQIRVNAEAAALYRSGNLELKKTNSHLNKLLKVQSKLIRRQYALNFSINMADYIGSILSYLVISVPIFLGAYNHLSPSDLSALISKNAFVCIYLINCFTRLIDMALQVSDIAGTTHRIAQMIEKLLLCRDPGDVTKFTPDMDGTYTITNTNVDEDRVAYKATNITYSAPGESKILVKNLSLEFKQGVNLLVTGDSGCGKTSLLRVLNGLWSPRSGSIDRNVPLGPNGIFYLPQKPYFTNGSLREQIIYPQMISITTDSEDSEIQDLIQLTGLTSLLHRAGNLDGGEDWNWYDKLSPGEMQRLSFVRLFYHYPKFAVLDEATSQIGMDLEIILYNKCKTMGITLLSVGHRSSLLPFHDKRLHLKSDTSWTLSDIDHNIGAKSDAC